MKNNMCEPPKRKVMEIFASVKEVPPGCGQIVKVNFIMFPPNPPLERKWHRLMEITE